MHICVFPESHAISKHPFLRGLAESVKVAGQQLSGRTMLPLDIKVIHAALPVAFLLLFPIDGMRGRWRCRMLQLHLFLCFLYIALYVVARAYMMGNIGCSRMMSTLSLWRTRNARRRYEHVRGDFMMVNGQATIVHSCAPGVRPSRRIIVFTGFLTSVQRLVEEAYLAPLLEGHVELVAVQPRGFGDSDPWVDITAESLERDAFDAFVHMCGEFRSGFVPTIVVGYSMGCMLAAMLARRLSQLLAAPWAFDLLVLTAGCYDASCSSRRLRWRCDNILDIRCEPPLLDAEAGPIISSKPLLVLHSVDDRSVRFEEAERFWRRRVYAGQHATLVPLRGVHDSYEVDEPSRRAISHACETAMRFNSKASQ